MYSEEDDFKEVFPDLDCDNLPEDDSVDNPDREPENPDKKPENPDKKPDNDKNDDHSDQEMEPESHLNFEPHNSNIQNFINYNTDFETKINFNMGKTCLYPKLGLNTFKVALKSKKNMITRWRKRPLFQSPVRKSPCKVFTDF